MKAHPILFLQVRKPLDKVLTPIDIEVLLDHISRGASDPIVGFEHAYMNMYELIGHISTGRPTLDQLEAALWSCNLLNERDKWVHPDRVSFDEFVNHLSPIGYKFDHFFNMYREVNKDV